MNLFASRGMAVAAALTVVAAHAAAQPRVTDERVQELIRAAAQRAGINETATIAQPPTATQGELALTLDDAIKLALERNLDIQVQRLNPETFDYAVAAQQAFYRPSLISTISDNHQTNPANTTIAGGARAGQGIEQGLTTYNGGIAQNVKWGGGNFSLTLNNNRQTTSSLNALYTPQFNTNWALQYNQPLLRNFRIDNARQQLLVTSINRDISEIQLQALTINTVSNVRNAYWDYVFAVQSVEVARQSLALAEQLVADNQTRVEIGTMAPIDVVQAQSQAATQRQNLATAEGTRRTAELTLKRLIVNGTQDPNWSASINPVDRPDFAPAPIDVTMAVRRGLENRTDLQQARKNLQVNDVALKLLHNQTLPQVDLSARYGLVGIGGTRYQRDVGAGGSGDVIASFPGGYSDAITSLWNGQYPTWNLSLNVTYPLGTNAAQSNLARARVQERQVEAQLRQIELQIATDITNAATQVQNNVERVQAAQSAREFSQRTLEAEQSKFEVGMSTNYFVVQAQRDLATAQNLELQAVLAYRRSIVELERLQQTSLTTSNITVLGRQTVGGQTVATN